MPLKERAFEYYHRNIHIILHISKTYSQISLKVEPLDNRSEREIESIGETGDAENFGANKTERERKSTTPEQPKSNKMWEKGRRLIMGRTDGNGGQRAKDQRG